MFLRKPAHLSKIIFKIVFGKRIILNMVLFYDIKPIAANMHCVTQVFYIMIITWFSEHEKITLLVPSSKSFHSSSPFIIQFEYNRGRVNIFKKTIKRKRFCVCLFNKNNNKMVSHFRTLPHMTSIKIKSFWINCKHLPRL